MSALSAQEVLQPSIESQRVGSMEETLEPAPEEKSRWSWSKFSLRDLWISTSKEELLEAERDFIDTFIDPAVLEVTVQDVPIFYDVTPIKIKQANQNTNASKSRWGHLKTCQSRSNDGTVPNSEPPNGIQSADLLPPQHNETNTEKPNELNELDVQSILNDTDEDNQKHEESQQQQQQQQQQEEKECNEHIHTVTFRLKNSNATRENVEPRNRPPPIVLLHGYGCAGGIHIPAIHSIFKALSKRLGKDVVRAVNPEIHVVDWLGNGASSRPKFDQENFTVEDTENWFVDSLEEWRKKMNHEDLILVGHSLGGYMSAVYSLRYPERVAHLVLVSPAGVPRVPPGFSIDQLIGGLDWKRRFAIRTLQSLWMKGWTPHDIVRYSGPKGKDWVTKLVSRRLFRVPDEDPLKPVLSNYLYHVYSGSGSAEYALNKVFQPGAFAWNPLVDRLPHLKTYQQIRSKNAESKNEEFKNEEFKNEEPKNEAIVVESGENVKIESSNMEEKKSEEAVYVIPPGIIHNSRHPTLRVDVMFGETDWMDPSPWHHFESHKLLESKLYVLRDCGHQLILEQPLRFGKKVGKISSQCFGDFYRTYLQSNEQVERNVVSNEITQGSSNELEVKTSEPEERQLEGDENELESESSEEPPFRGRTVGQQG